LFEIKAPRRRRGNAEIGQENPGLEQKIKKAIILFEIKARRTAERGSYLMGSDRVKTASQRRDRARESPYKMVR
jgi:hypothetical protein